MQWNWVPNPSGGSGFGSGSRLQSGRVLSGNYGLWRGVSMRSGDAQSGEPSAPAGHSDPVRRRTVAIAFVVRLFNSQSASFQFVVLTLSSTSSAHFAVVFWKNPSVSPFLIDGSIPYSIYSFNLTRYIIVIKKLHFIDILERIQFHHIEHQLTFPSFWPVPSSLCIKERLTDCSLHLNKNAFSVSL